MRYWVYINDKVIEKPFEEGELASIPGFNSNTLICKETPAEGETQTWVPAKNLIAAYRQPVPPPPPTPQNINQYASVQEPKQSTILSSNIFGSEENEMHIYETPDKKQVNPQTESISPQEQASFDDDIFNDVQTTEVVSIDDVKEVDVDTHLSQDSDNEEEILKTAIRSLISPENEKDSGEQSFQAIDIAHNRNIDLSEPQEENIDKLVSNISKKDKITSTNPVVENVSNAELTPLGESKTGINHLFAVDDQQEEQLAQEQNTQEVPAEQTEPQEEQAAQEQDTQEVPAEQVEPQEEQAATESLEEEEFIPEEEISLDDDDFIVHDFNSDKDVLTKDAPSAKEQEVLQELAADKEEDLKAAEEEGEELEEAFKTAPALVAELPQENKEEEITQEPNKILELSNEPKSSEENPMTLEELTGKIDAPTEEAENDFVPAEVHSDVIVEEVKEEAPAKEEVKEEEEEEKKPQPEQDNFLNTFSSDIETVFLDQPTAFISDYIPPEATKDLAKEIQLEAEKEAQGDILDIKSSQGQHQVQNVRRVKPAAIKTVPMVDGEQVDPFSKTQIRRFEVAEQAKAKIEDRNSKLNIVFAILIAILFILVALGFLGLIAQIGIWPKDLSPIHAFLFKATKKEKVATPTSDKKLTPEELALKDLKDAQEKYLNDIIDKVKNFELMEGITLGEKIRLLHPTIYSQLKWEAYQQNDLTYYDVTVSSPANQDGFSQVSYKFKYNTVNYNVEAQNNESNNVMINPIQANN